MSFTFVLLLPLLEFLGLRYFVAHVVDLHPGYGSITDYDFVPPSIVAFSFLAYLMGRKKAVKVRFNPIGLLVNLASMSIFVYLSHRFFQHENLWYFFAVFTILSAIFILLPPREIFFHPEKHLIPIAILAGLSKMIGRICFSGLWPPVAKLTAVITCFSLSPFLTSMSCEFDAMERASLFHRLNHPLFTIAIGTGCSGLEGVFFFLFMGLLIVMARVEEWGWLKSSLFLAIGVPGIYAMNILRISVFYVVAIVVHREYGAVESGTAFIALFHSLVGWFLYLLFFGGYYVSWDKVLVVLPATFSPSSTEKV
jgi:exosortase/archaeosortase family protein